ncbi:MAG: hypothetical protein HQ513_01785 [Rhodospirillales bacterium]|nr:hypothetical protein [Rhodospirillales bacterium]
MKKMLATAILLSFLPFGVAFTPVDATAQVVCVERVKFIERLRQLYAERPVSSGLNFNGVMVEVFASEGGHFTILATRPDGVSCLIASGKDWQEMPFLKAEIGI